MFVWQVAVPLLYPPSSVKIVPIKAVWLQLILVERVSKRLVFTTYGIVVAVVIRSVQRHDLVKIKLAESEADTDYACDSVAFRPGAN